MAAFAEISAKLDTAIGILNAVQAPAINQAQADALDAKAQAVIQAAQAVAARVEGGPQ